jgi:hypothetical protein
MVLTGHTRLFDVDEMRLEHALGSLVPLRTDLDHPSIRQLQQAISEVAISNRQMARKGSGTLTV